MSKQQRKRQQGPAHEEGPDEAKRRRVINNCVGYWKVCGAGACRRQRGCAGDAVACFERFWPWTPERIKIQIRASIKALSDGVTSADELVRIVDAEVERAAEHIARVDAETARAWEAAQRAPSPLPPRALASGAEGPGVGGAKAAAGPRVRAL